MLASTRIAQGTEKTTRNESSFMVSVVIVNQVSRKACGDVVVKVFLSALILGFGEPLNRV